MIYRTYISSVLIALIVLAQTPSGPIVELSLIVTDKDRKSLKSINKDEIRIVEDKVEQTVLSVEPDNRPTDYGLLIDCSNERMADQVVKRFLRAQGIGSIANVLLTHGDTSHVSGFRIISEEFAPQAVLTSAVRARSRIYRGILAQLEQFSGVVKKVSAGDSVFIVTASNPLVAVRTA